MQCACAVLSSVACPDLPHFSTLCYKQHDFRENIAHTNLFFIVSTTFDVTFLILRRTERDMIKNVYCSSCKVTCYSRHILSLILLTWRIWWAPNNASRWQMGFNLEFKGLKCPMDKLATWMVCQLVISLHIASCAECTSIAGHSSQHNITQHGMLPQHATCTTKLICDYF